jgi:hypothetical protein
VYLSNKIIFTFGEPLLIEIVGHKKTRIFNLQEAQSLLQLIYRVTEESNKKVKALMACVDALPDKKSARALEFQDQINSYIGQWQNKIERLGGKPKGLWLADFDNGSGYYCWKFPETEISFFHGYQDGFTGRKLIPEKDLIHENSNSTN